MSEKLIAIGGGVGPMAGVHLHRLIIEHTLTDGIDQTHLSVAHLSFSSIIPDRTEYLLGKSSENPAFGMAETMLAAEAAAGVIGKKVVAEVPCSTSHSPAIFDVLVSTLAAKGSSVRLVNMMKETADLLCLQLPSLRKVGLMTTTGARRVKVFNRVLEPLGFNILEVPDDVQSELHETIYNKEWGIKAASPASDTSRYHFERYVRLLVSLGAEAVILGCTEIPIVLPEASFEGTPLIDPMVALARSLIREAAPSKLRPLSTLKT